MLPAQKVTDTSGYTCVLFEMGVVCYFQLKTGTEEPHNVPQSHRTVVMA